MLTQGYFLSAYGFHSVVGRGALGIAYEEKHKEPGVEIVIKEYSPSELCVRHGRILRESVVCHQDVNPSNILICYTDRTAVLIDFGASKHEMSRHTNTFAPYSDGYAAMEQIGEREVGPWTDMYAVGLVTWRIVAGGALPFSPPKLLSGQNRTCFLGQELV